jgi:hypothetical protein
MSALLRPRWQVRATALIALLGPPTASLILLAVDYFKYWRAVLFNIADFLAALFLLAIPIGYAFGAVPALLTVLLYCVLLPASSRLLQRRLLTRACAGAISGGLASWAWFREWLNAWGIYGLVGAVVMAILSLGLGPRRQTTHGQGVSLGEFSQSESGVCADIVRVDFECHGYADGVEDSELGDLAHRPSRRHSVPANSSNCSSPTAQSRLSSSGARPIDWQRPENCDRAGSGRG